ncbi:MAG: hypothetical protein CM15mP58_18370 [Burkholderiaceae bacterium]|nr:MAG: hypothetical protein CM15mP58_18370 [Burkholderiaceae bacterium]
MNENGKFIFDTPNRLITSIQSDSFIDPDHKIEYTPDQLESILRKHNFSISDSWGLLPMPMTFQLKNLVLKKSMITLTVRGFKEFVIFCVFMYS